MSELDKDAGSNLLLRSGEVLRIPLNGRSEETKKLLSERYWDGQEIENIQSQLDTYKKLYEIQRESSDFYGDKDSWNYRTAKNTKERVNVHLSLIEQKDLTRSEQFIGAKVFNYIGGKKARETNKQCDEILTTLNKGDNNV